MPITRWIAHPVFSPALGIPKDLTLQKPMEGEFKINEHPAVFIPDQTPVPGCGDCSLRNLLLMSTVKLINKV